MTHSSARQHRGTQLLVAVWLIASAGGAWSSVLELEVSTTADAGEGSLRAALETANAQPERPARITFGERGGPFSTPQTIELQSPLPVIKGEITIDGFISNLLWRPYGATISGAGEHRLFEVAPGGHLRLTGVTLRNGRAESGGAVLNHGRLEVEGVSLFDNSADQAGGAIANHGKAFVINSTLAWNRAGRGGGVAHLAGELSVINATVYQNEADTGAAVWSSSSLHLANSIVAGNPDLQQCLNTGALSAQTTHNLIHGGHRGCGEPILDVDPGLEDRTGYYNGPTPTIPVSGSSPVVNLGLNEAAVDARGRPLQWDQRGNGDPRFASGYTDIGAFERQGHLPTEFLVDTIEDTGLRACAVTGNANCPLRAALELAVAARHPTPVKFNPEVFEKPRRLVLNHIPDLEGHPIMLDGKGAAPITIVVPFPVDWEVVNGVEIIVDAKIAGGTP